MAAFTALTAIAAPLPGDNVDTDQIFPARFMSKPRGAGFAGYLLHDHRFAESGAEHPDFVLNREPFRRAQILVAGENFACGSAREHAVGALLDYGIRVVIAASMGDIFASSAMENGLLTITLGGETMADLVRRLEDTPGATLTVDLESGLILRGNEPPIPFAISSRRRQALLADIDPLSQTLQSLPAILEFEARHEAWTPPAR